MGVPRLSPIRALASPVPLAVGAVPWPSSTKVTLIVKLSSLLGQGVLSARFPGDALSLDATDSTGELLYPSDFAPYKPRPEVVIVADDVRARAHAAVLTCGSLAKHAPPGASLGGRELFVEAGDPTEPSAEKAWGAGKIDFRRFQSAPPDQRLDSLPVPFRVFYQRGEIHFGGEFQGPVPEIVLVDTSGQKPSSYVTLLLDTVCISPSRARMTLLWRGIADLGLVTPGAALIGVTLSTTPARSNQEILSWPKRDVVYPWQLRKDSIEGETIAAPLKSPNVVLDSPTEDETNEVDSLSGTIERDPSHVGQALPFRARSNAKQPVAESEDQVEVDHLGETLGLVGRPVSTPLPFLPAAPDPTSDEPRQPIANPRALAGPKVESATPWQRSTVPLSLADIAPARAPAATPARDLPLAECARIAASIARRPSEKDAVLEAHDLDAASWAAADARVSETAREASSRGDPSMMLAYDAAYVDQLEKERGPIEVPEWARIVVAGERGTTNEVLEDLSLPLSALPRIERVWLKRLAADVALGKAVNRAVKAARSDPP